MFLDFLIICEVFTVFSRFQHAGNSQTPVLTLNWLFIWSSQVFSDLSNNDTSVSGLLACMKLKLCHLLLVFVNQEIWSLRKAEGFYIGISNVCCFSPVISGDHVDTQNDSTQNSARVAGRVQGRLIHYSNKYWHDVQLVYM